MLLASDCLLICYVCPDFLAVMPRALPSKHVWASELEAWPLTSGAIISTGSGPVLQAGSLDLALLICVSDPGSTNPRDSRAHSFVQAGVHGPVGRGLTGSAEDQFHASLSVAKDHSEGLVLSLELLKQPVYC